MRKCQRLMQEFVVDSLRKTVNISDIVTSVKTKRLQFTTKQVQSMMTLLMKSAEVIIFRTIKSQAKYYIKSSTEDSV